MVLRGGSPAGKHSAGTVIGGSNEIFNTVHANEERLEALVSVEVVQTAAGTRVRLTNTLRRITQRKCRHTPGNFPQTVSADLPTRPRRTLFN